MALSIQTVFLLCSTLLAPGQNGSTPHVSSSGGPTMPHVIVIGFVGGYVKQDNLVHSAVQLAAHLRGDYTSCVYAEVFENHRREKAHRILKESLRRTEIDRLVSTR